MVWIKWEKGLARKPEVLLISRLTGLDRHSVAGILMEFWEWLDENFTDPGRERDLFVPIESSQLCRSCAGFVPNESFIGAMIDAKWIRIVDGGFLIPKYGRHNGKSAKARALHTKNVGVYRQSVPVLCPQNSHDCDDATVTREEKRREEKKEDTFSTEPQSAAAVPEPCLLEFPTTGTTKTWGLTQTLTDSLVEAYPAVDVLAEARKARCWCISNPTKQKTPRGMPKFLNGWMERAQNSARNGRANLHDITEYQPTRSDKIL